MLGRKTLSSANSSGQGGGRYLDYRSSGVPHRGIDIEAPSGTNVLASGGGTGVSVYDPNGAGIALEIYHPGGIVTRYYHLGSRIGPAGIGLRFTVADGTNIGTVGRTGNVGSGFSTHLHFELIINNQPVDPYAYFGYK